jgi:2-polyprenyl-3-methyl-5-hydroxy-6-metoxy-1,4-benzoquinol methylase
MKSGRAIAFPKIPVVRCCQCGFIYSRNILAGKEIEAYYENGFGSRRHMQGQIVNSKINSMALERLVDLQKIRKMLDVGTGYGFLLRELASRYDKLNAVGVELSRQEAEFANNDLGLNVINSPLGDSDLTKDFFDLVTAFEVIEHTPYPIKFILELTEFVNSGGYLLIMTDNFDSRMANSLGAGFPKWIPHSHISHFSPLTLRKAIEKTKKLEIVESMSYTPWEVLLRNAYYKLRGIKKEPSEVFDLTTTLCTEMQGTYKLFAIRNLFNRLWARKALSRKMDGDLMYFLCKKIA